jgi:hypothetical protein
MVVGIEKHVQNEHLLNNTVKELVINLKSSDSNTSKEDENSLEGTLPPLPDSECCGTDVGNSKLNNFVKLSSKWPY